MKRLYVLLTVTALAMAGCGWPVRHEKLTAGYVLSAIDEPEDLSICYQVEQSCIGGIDGTIAEVGWNNRYMVAERHPGNNRSISEFYYIDLKVKDSAMSGVTGPLTQEQFRQKSTELGLPPLSRTIDGTYSLEKP